MSYSKAAQEYLKSICKLGGGQEPVAVSALATRLDVSPVSAHEMVRRLAEQDLLLRGPFLGRKRSGRLLGDQGHGDECRSQQERRNSGAHGAGLRRTG